MVLIVVQPVYAQAVANYIHRSLRKGEPVKIFEIGAGNGTCAQNILDYFKEETPTLYPNLKYTIIEISEQMTRRQRERISHFDQIKIVNESIFSLRTIENDPCYIVGLEVLDNLPQYV